VHQTDTSIGRADYVRPNFDYGDGNMLASELFRGKWNTTDTEITGITIDSRSVVKGNVFICINGLVSDGHDYAEKAVENGASVIVSERELPVNVPCIVYEDTRLAMAEISAKFYGYPENNLKLIGITGTNGKTTVSYLIKKILESAGKTVGIIGTNEILVGNEDVGIKSSTPTTPNSLELRRIFSKMCKMGAEYVVMEVSSHALDLYRVAGLVYDVGIFTNLTRDHLDYHKTMDNYFHAKKKLFDISKIAVINIDDEYGNRIAESSQCKKMTVSTDKADLVAENIKITARGISYTVKWGDDRELVTLGISGMFSVYNSLCAIAAAISSGIDLKTCALGIAASDGVKGRLERVETNTPYSVIIDYAHTPDGLENVITAVNSFKKGRCITVFGCGGDRDATKRPIMGEIGARLSDLAIITSDNPRCENPAKIIEDVVSGIKTGNYEVIENRREAIRYALSVAEKDDIVLLCGKGQETYQIIGTEKTHFDEREVVRELLGE